MMSLDLGWSDGGPTTHVVPRITSGQPGTRPCIPAAFPVDVHMSTLKSHARRKAHHESDAETRGGVLIAGRGKLTPSVSDCDCLGVPALFVSAATTI